MTRQVIWQRGANRLEYSTHLELYFLYINDAYERDFETIEAANHYMKRRNGEDVTPIKKLD